MQHALEIDLTDTSTDTSIDTSADASETLIETHWAYRPWLYAREGSWWLITGRASAHHDFVRCTARVLPASAAGTCTYPIFEVLTDGPSFAVHAGQISDATEIFFVHASKPMVAVEAGNQLNINLAKALATGERR